VPVEAEEAEERPRAVQEQEPARVQEQMLRRTRLEAAAGLARWRQRQALQELDSPSAEARS
jgi:hypothetical protein